MPGSLTLAERVQSGVGAKLRSSFRSASISDIGTDLSPPRLLQQKVAGTSWRLERGDATAHPAQDGAGHASGRVEPQPGGCPIDNVGIDGRFVCRERRYEGAVAHE